MALNSLRSMFRPKSEIERLLEEFKRVQLLTEPKPYPQVTMRINLNQETEGQRTIREQERNMITTFCENGRITYHYKCSLQTMDDIRHPRHKRKIKYFGTCWNSFKPTQYLEVHEIIDSFNDIENKHQIGLTSMQIANLELVKRDGGLCDLVVKRDNDFVLASIYNTYDGNITGRSFGDYPLDGQCVRVSRELAEELKLKPNDQLRIKEIRYFRGW